MRASCALVWKPRLSMSACISLNVFPSTLIRWASAPSIEYRTISGTCPGMLEDRKRGVTGERVSGGFAVNAAAASGPELKVCCRRFGSAVRERKAQGAVEDGAHYFTVTFG